MIFQLQLSIWATHIEFYGQGIDIVEPKYLKYSLGKYIFQIELYKICAMILHA